jgi:hypothetical protein
MSYSFFSQPNSQRAVLRRIDAANDGHACLITGDHEQIDQWENLKEKIINSTGSRRSDRGRECPTISSDVVGRIFLPVLDVETP